MDKGGWLLQARLWGAPDPFDRGVEAGHRLAVHLKKSTQHELVAFPPRALRA